MLDPQALSRSLKLPEGARPLAVLCLGEVDAFYPEPMLETLDWGNRLPTAELVFRDT